MNRFVTAIALATSLSILQGCSTVSTTTPPTSSSTPSHSVDHADQPDEHHSDDGNPNEPELSNSTATAKLIAPDTLAPATDLPLALHIEDETGNAIANFDIFQEHQLHLIVVSNDLNVFQHLHPTYQGKGHFTFDANFPQAGNYTLFADYKPQGSQEQVSVLPVTIPGSASNTPIITFDRTKTIANTQATLDISQAVVTAGQDVTLTFDLKDAITQQSVTNLQPYLGEAGHLVIVRQSPSLTTADYIHAHALPNAADSQIRFSTRFPQPGYYKLWGQFNRNGDIIAADFWVEVVE